MGKMLVASLLLLTIYVYNHETKTETPCEDTIENCIKKTVAMLEKDLQDKQPTWDSEIIMEKA